MTDKEIRRLNKTELLWIIHDQEEEIQELKKQLLQYTESAAEESLKDTGSQGTIALKERENNEN